MYSGEVKATDEDKDGIKGPVSQYNFFSMESRKHIRDGSCSIEVSYFYSCNVHVFFDRFQ